MAINEDSTLPCDICGEKNGTVYWQGVVKRIEVCQDCAKTILPRLIADAVVMHDRARLIEIGKLAMLEIEKNFWRSFAAGIQRWRDEARKPEMS